MSDKPLEILLERFKKAQSGAESGFESALAEIKSGRKRGHWIWYIFPQLSGLGSSPVSEMYAIESPGEAAEYLRDPTLSVRLLSITTAVAERLRDGASLPSLMGSRTDALKLVSSLTLFACVADELHRTDPRETYRELAQTAEDVLKEAESQGYPRCRVTLERLRH